MPPPEKMRVTLLNFEIVPFEISQGAGSFRHSSTKHILQCVVSGQTPEIAFSRPLGFAFGLWAPIAAIAPSMPMCHPMYK